MSGSPRTAAGRALLDRVSPPVGDNVDPEEEWVAEAWAHRNEIEGAILAIEAEAATLGESRTLDPTTLFLDGTERADGYDPDQQLARRIGHWLDELVLHGALGEDDRRRLRFTVGPGESRTLVERIGALPTFDVVTDTDGTGGRMVALDAVLAAL